MSFVGLGASLFFAAGAVCLCFACFHMFVLLPRWRRSMRALDGMANDDRYDYEDVVPALKLAESKSGGSRRCTERRKSFS